MKNLHKLFNFAVYDIPENRLSSAKFGNQNRVFRQRDDSDYDSRMRQAYNRAGHSRLIPYETYREIINGANTDPNDPYNKGIMTDPGFRQISRVESNYVNDNRTYTGIELEHDVQEFKLNGNLDWDEVFSKDPYAWQYFQLVTNNPNNNKFTGLLLNEWENSYNSLIPTLAAFNEVTGNRDIDTVDPRAVISLNGFLMTSQTSDYAKLTEYWDQVVNSNDPDYDELKRSLKFLGTNYGQNSEDSDIRSLNNAQCLYILSRLNSDKSLDKELKLLENKIDVKDIYKLLDNVFSGKIYDSTISRDEFINNKNEYTQISSDIKDYKNRLKVQKSVDRGAAIFAKYINKKSREELNQNNKKLADQLSSDMRKSLYNKELSGIEKLLAYGQFNKKVGMQDGRVSKLVGTRPKAQDDKKVAEYLAQSMSNAELNEVIKSIGMDDKIDIIVGYANTNHGKLDEKFRRMIGFPDRENSFFGYKLEVSKDPFEKKLGLRTRNLNDDRVLREKLSTMTKYDIDKVLKHINENSDKDPTTAMRVTEAAKVLKNNVTNFIDMYTVGMKFFSYVFILDPKNPLVRFDKFLKTLKRVYDNFNRAKENIIQFQRAFLV